MNVTLRASAYLIGTSSLSGHPFEGFSRPALSILGSSSGPHYVWHHRGLRDGLGSGVVRPRVVDGVPLLGDALLAGGPPPRLEPTPRLCRRGLASARRRTLSPSDCSPFSKSRPGLNDRDVGVLDAIADATDAGTGSIGSARRRLSFFEEICSRAAGAEVARRAAGACVRR